MAADEPTAADKPTAAEEIVGVYGPVGDLSAVEIGTAPRSRVRAENLPHAGTGILVRDPAGRIYVHRRADTKDINPGGYDCFAGGVVGADEAPQDCAGRELAEELGIRGPRIVPLFRQWYVDRSTCYLACIFAVTWDGALTHQPEEVAWGDWMTPGELAQRLADPDWRFVPDALSAYDECRRRGIIG
ncbi:MAG: NUDIX hydrolase [Mycobacteriales bacterium]